LYQSTIEINSCLSRAESFSLRTLVLFQIHSK